MFATDNRPRHRIRKAIIATTVAATMAAAGYFTLGTASADVRSGTINETLLTLSDESLPSPDVARLYNQNIEILRQFASVPSSDGGSQTQNNSVGLIDFRIKAFGDDGEKEIRVYIDPSNLYVMGFQAAGSGQTWKFSDTTWTDTNPVNTSQFTLPFGGSYTDLERAGSRPRTQVPVAYLGIEAAVLQLANTPISPSGVFGGDSQATARSLLMMIQMLSESARFVDTFDHFRNAMETFDEDVLPTPAIELQNNWSQLSAAFTSGVSVPISGIGDLQGQVAIRQHVPVLHGPSV